MIACIIIASAHYCIKKKNYYLVGKAQYDRTQATVCIIHACVFQAASEGRLIK